MIRALSLLKRIAVAGMIISSFASCKNAGNAVVDLIVTDSSKVTSWSLFPADETTGQYTLAKENDQWFIRLRNGKRAAPDPDYLRRSLSHINRFRSFTYFGNHKDSMAKYGFQKPNILQIYEGTKPTDKLYIGNAFFTDSGQIVAYYVHKEGSDDVYGVKLPLSGSLAATLGDFRGKRMVPLSVQDIRSVQVMTSQGEHYEIAQVGQGSYLVDGRVTNMDKLLAYLNNLVALQAKGYTEEPRNGAEYALEIVQQDGKAFSVKASPTQEGKWILTSTLNAGNYMEISGVELQALFPPRSYFLPGVK